MKGILFPGFVIYWPFTYASSCLIWLFRWMQAHRVQSSWFTMRIWCVLDKSVIIASQDVILYTLTWCWFWLTCATNCSLIWMKWGRLIFVLHWIRGLDSLRKCCWGWITVENLISSTVKRIIFGLCLLSLLPETWFVNITTTIITNNKVLSY